MHLTLPVVVEQRVVKRLGVERIHLRVLKASPPLVGHCHSASVSLDHPISTARNAGRISHQAASSTKGRRLKRAQAGLAAGRTDAGGPLQRRRARGSRHAPAAQTSCAAARDRARARLRRTMLPRSLDLEGKRTNSARFRSARVRFWGQTRVGLLDLLRQPRLRCPMKMPSGNSRISGREQDVPAREYVDETCNRRTREQEGEHDGHASPLAAAGLLYTSSGSRHPGRRGVARPRSKNSARFRLPGVRFRGQTRVGPLDVLRAALSSTEPIARQFHEGPAVKAERSPVWRRPG